MKNNMKETMSSLRLFWVPDYYERFQCKADRCRINCCHGWNVTISQQDYFNLLSVPCSKELRRKLDIALHPVSNPDTQRFAQISHDWLGNCPLQREDGLCTLQAECGETALSSTCRYYPRGIRTAFVDECCCSGSCEGVLETMFASHAPIRMVQRKLTFDLSLPPRAENESSAQEDRKIQSEWIGILQDRRYSFAERLQRLGRTAHALHREEGDLIYQMEKALHGFVPCKDLDLLPAFAVQRDFLFAVCEQSESLRPFAEAVIDELRLFPSGADQLKNAFSRYQIALKHFETVIPDWEICFEHMLVNHILYQGYPYSERHESVWDEYMALCALYAALRVLSVGYTMNRENRNDFVDVCAAAFRLFEHANFNHNSMVVFRQRGMTELRDMDRCALL